MKRPSLKIPNLKGFIKNSKEKEQQQRNLESSTLKMLTFAITLVAMALGMSFLPLFPQPLPLLLAVLVAFITLKDPRFGMPVGGVIIGLGLMYHLSIAPIYFISYLGAEQIRVAFVFVWMALFVALPVIFHRFKAALAIDFGILSVTMLFFGSTYFLAIPLIMASAVFFKKYVSLSVVYYALISVPLMISQYYLFTVKPIVQTDWWNVAGSSPPVFTSLSPILSNINSSISQFRLYDTSQFIYSITGQLTWTPNILGRSMGAAFSQYLDSLPGIFMFMVILVGLASTVLFFTQILTKEGFIGSGDRLFPCFVATITAAMFFIFISALQYPLAFTADVGPSTMVLGILATLFFTLPVAFMDYTPKQSATTPIVTQKAQTLLGKLQTFEAQLNNVKASIPVVVSSPEGRMLVIKDSLEDTLKKSKAEFYETVELNRKFDELQRFGKDIDSLEGELNAILSEYQVFVTCEYSNWVGKLKDSGLEIKTANNIVFQKEMALDARVDAIKQILDAGRSLAIEVAQIAEPIYAVIRPLYDPALPEKSRSIEFTMQKLEQKEAPWIAIEALYNSLNNWKRQYGKDIVASMQYLKNSLVPIASLSGENEVLPPIFGSKLPKVLDYARKAEAMKTTGDRKAEGDQLNLVDVISLKDDIQSFLDISEDVLGMLYSQVVSEEDALDRLLPTKDFIWDKNSTLRERLKKATETLSNPSGYQINQIMQNLPGYLNYVDEAVQTLAVYNERKEFLLNYPTAEAAIEDQLKKKKSLSPQDLPFQTRFAAEYMRLYYTQRFGDFNYDKENMQLTKKN